MTKLCRKCGAEKPHDSFARARQNKDGLNSYCRDCNNDWARRRRAARKRGDLPTVMVTVQTCGTCREELPREAFYADRLRASGLALYCKRCTAEKKRRQVYGLPLGRYRAMLEAQEGRCHICRQASGALVVDHDHASGRVRGLLCNRCNLALGLLGDDPGVAAAVVDYLTQALVPQEEAV